MTATLGSDYRASERERVESVRTVNDRGDGYDSDDSFGTDSDDSVLDGAFDDLDEDERYLQR